MTMMHFHLISGCMVGIEFPPPEEPEEAFLMTIDLFFIRLWVVKLK